MIIEANNLSCGYGGTPLLSHVSLCVQSGEIICLLGPNGVGKTTLFKTLLGFLPLLSGTITIDGEDRSHFNRRQFAQRVAYVPQIHEPPFAYSVLDVVLTGCVSQLGIFSTPTKIHHERAQQILEELGILHLENRVYTEISGGEQQMTLIARALMQNSRILVMDEPAAALDFGNQVRVLSCIKAMAAQEQGIIMTSHNPDHAYLCCTRALLITKNKKILCGAVDEILTEKNLNEAYGIQVKVSEIRNDKGERVKTCTPLLEEQNSHSAYFHSMR